jgi:hypothetical protein
MKQVRAEVVKERRRRRSGGGRREAPGRRGAEEHVALCRNGVIVEVSCIQGFVHGLTEVWVDGGRGRGKLRAGLGRGVWRLRTLV